MKKIITLLMCLICCCSYAFLHEGNGGQWLCEDIAVGSGGSEVIKYEIVYKDYDGTVLGSFIVNRLESTPELEEEPSRTGFNFVGWSPSVSPLARNDATYIAQYEMIYSEGLAFELSADGNFYYVAGIGIHGNDTAINIPPTHEGLPVEKIKYQAFRSNTKMTDVYIPDSVNEIGSYSFNNCNKLVNITGGENVSIVGSYSYSSCSLLSDVPFLSHVSYIGADAFRYCKALTKIEVGTEILEEETYVGSRAFNRCDALVEATFGDNVATLSTYVLSDCDSLKRVHLSDNISSIGEYFTFGCDSLEYANIPASQTFIDDLTYCLGNATGTLVISERITRLGDTAIIFGGEKIIFKNGSLVVDGNRTSGSHAVVANNLKEVVICFSPTQISATTYTNLLGFSNLEKIYFDEKVFLDWIYDGTSGSYGFNRINFQNGGSACGYIQTTATYTASFYNIYCENDTIDIRDGVLYGYKEGQPESETLYIPEGVTAIAENAFANHSLDFAEIFIPETVQSIGDGAFDNTQITRIIFEGHPTSISGFNGATIGRVFYPYYSSYKDTRGNDITESLWVLNNERVTLGGCTPTQFIGFGGDPSGFGSLVSGKLSFQNSGIYSNSKSPKKYAYYIPASGKTSASSDIYVTEAFSGSSSSNKFIEGGASEGTCVKVMLPDTITTLSRYYVFLRNEQLREFEMPPNLTTLGSGSTDSSQHFRGTLLDHVNLPSTLTGQIPQNCFADMASLTSIIIPAGVTSIGTSGIGMTTNNGTVSSGLQTVTYLGNPPTGNYQCRYLDGITIRYLDTNASAWASYTALDTFGGATNVTWEMITEDDI